MLGSIRLQLVGTSIYFEPSYDLTVSDNTFDENFFFFLPLYLNILSLTKNLKVFQLSLLILIQFFALLFHVPVSEFLPSCLSLRTSSLRREKQCPYPGLPLISSWSANPVAFPQSNTRLTPFRSEQQQQRPLSQRFPH